MHPIIKKIYQQAQSNPKNIILTESKDPRIQKAIKIIEKEKIANIILVDQNYIQSKPELLKQFSNQFFELRKNKGLSIEESKEIVKDPIYFATLMVNNNLADALVAGTSNTTANTLRPALQIIKAKKEEIISTFFIMETKNKNLGEDGIFIFADCALNMNPNAQQLAQIAIQSAKSFKQLIASEPKVAMLSYSTNGSAQSESTEKVKKATQLVKEKDPLLNIEGEIQPDAAIVPQVCLQKNDQSQLKGKANILIFPDLNSGNIAYKLVERLANAKAFGPLTQGINKPINDLSRGCDTEDIVTTVALTVAQLNAN